MLRSLRRLLLASLSFATWQSAAQAFDCARAREAIDKAICADPTTKASDDAMSAAFVRARKGRAPDQSKALLVNQRRWLKTRSDECFGGSAVSHCLLAENKARISVLEPRRVAGHALRLVLVETPLTKTAYALGLLLYKFADPRNAAEQTFDADIDKRIAEAPRKREADDQAGNDYEAYETASVAHASDKLLSVKVDTLLWAAVRTPTTARRRSTSTWRPGRIFVSTIWSTGRGAAAPANVTRGLTPRA